MQALAGDPIVADAAKGPVVFRGLRAVRADQQLEVRLASSGEDINASQARPQVAHHRLLKPHA